MRPGRTGRGHNAARRRLVRATLPGMQIIDASHRLSLERIELAATVIDPLFGNTPQYDCPPLSQALGAALTLKVETMNPLRSFKGRGADFFAHEHAALLAGCSLVCASAGNFGQAMAWVCRTRGWPLVVFASTAANPLKVERMRALGAEVRLAGADFDGAKQEALRYCEDRAARFVEDGREAAIAEGAGTIARELLNLPPFDAVLVPLGNGALLTGIGRWTKAHAPRVRVIGVSAAGADAMAASWRAGCRIERERADTIADGIAVRLPVPEALADMRGTVDDVLQVTDDAIRRAMRLLFQHAGLVVEPAGAAGVAALLEHPQLRGSRIATVLCGGNVTPAQATEWLFQGDAS